MYKIKIITNFSAAHFLRGYKGKCENMHGHNWKVEIAAVAHELDSLGMVMDFSELKKKAAQIMEELDHKQLNEVDYFKNNNPSSEQIARYIFTKLKSLINECQLEEVSVWETDTSCASYRE